MHVNCADFVYKEMRGINSGIVPLDSGNQDMMQIAGKQIVVLILAIVAITKC